MIALELRRLPCLLISSLLLLPAARAAGPESIETVEKAATEWVKTRAETVRLETEWLSQRALLDSVVKALSERALALEEKRDNLKAKTAKDRNELASLAARNQTADQELRTADGRLKTLGEKLGQLRPMLPPRLSAALELPCRSLAKPDLDASERMQLIMTILNRCLQFNRIITCENEVLSIAGEDGPRSLAVIYWGLSHGYALDGAGGRAWFGTPGQKGWEWVPCSDAAPQVAKLIAIYNDKAEPDFVTVPARLGHAPGATANP